MKSIYPPPLNPGDTIGVMAPSSRIDENALEAGADVLRARGYGVHIHPQCHASFHQSAGTPEQKRDALHDLVHDPLIKAIIFAGGGNRSLTFVDLIDFDLVSAQPKIYMGFSDCTAPLNMITAKTGIVTYHGPVVRRLPSNIQIDANFALLEGRAKDIQLEGAEVIQPGSAQGILFGGNLSLIRAMNESDMPSADGALLFLEEITEELSKVDRDFCALRRSGLLGRIGGLILGQFTNMTDTGDIPFGFTLEDIVKEHISGLGIPVLMNAPFGHQKELNYALPIGAEALLDGTTLRFIR